MATARAVKRNSQQRAASLMTGITSQLLPAGATYIYIPDSRQNRNREKKFEREEGGTGGTKTLRVESVQVIT